MCVDEFHQGGESHWKSFRPEMMRRSTSLRLYGVKNCPTICMTATATPKEIEGVEKAMGLREEAVKLTSSPVLDHMKFSIIRRPSNINGWEGIEKKDGTRNRIDEKLENLKIMINSASVDVEFEAELGKKINHKASILNQYDSCFLL